ncbi:GH92 family glycosyl hydrolase [Endozoicomonas sp. 4G]|uniref:GH92 family glycosyl hydrolase n=1 Tax=Endozoicomonas sp. 4G TaxID=2872754 RepID=UPI002078ABC0|nr:GH92 family glycosyl hydrolase [Endozoicomonas sp. 4G]
MFKKSITAVAVTAVLASLSGCDDNSSNSNTTQGGYVEPEILKYVDPFIGTDATGNTTPSAVYPEGMIQPGPDSINEDGTAGDYKYWKDTISGFSTTHLSGAGKGDLNDFAFLPFIDFESGPAKFSKENEEASPGYYSVEFDDSDIRTELTVTKRVALHRYTYPEGESRKLKLDLGHELQETYGNHSREIDFQIIGDNAIAGKRVSNEWAQYQTVYFYAEFTEPFVKYMAMDEGENTDDLNIEDSRDVIAFLDFGQGNQQLGMKIAISPNSIDGAKANIDAETDGFAFDQIRQDAANAWAETLSKIELEGGTEAEKTNFYTSMYHTYFAPFLYQDVDGQYRGMDGQSYQTDPNRPNYSVYSMWDTFRAAHPLKTITEKERSIEYVHDLINKFKKGDVLPKWELHSDYTGEMPGYPSVSIIADTMVKYPEAFTQQDFKDALEAALISSNWHPEITHDWIPYVDEWNGDKRWHVMTRHSEYQESDGFIGADIRKNPADIYDTIVNETVSYGLENAYYDWAIAQIAKLAGDEGQYDRYIKRSESFKNYFDHNPAYYAEYGATGFMRPKNRDGSWTFNDCSGEGQCTEENQDIFNPYVAEHRGEDFTEGSTWQWSWFVPHDIDGLMEIMGDEASFRQNLDALFNADPNGINDTGDMTGKIGQYVQGNEPDHHVPFLYNYTLEPWKTQEYLDQILDTLYLPTPEGIPGNEDVGQMSAWYMMTAMGFYQISPADPTYTIGRPLFDEVTIQLAEGEFTITTENNGPDNLYVQEVTINGEPLDENFTFQHEDIKPGGNLHFVMSDTPNKELR